MKKKSPTLLADALKAGVITQPEYQLIAEAERLRLDAIQVDDFDQQEYVTGLLKDQASAGGGVAGKSVAQGVQN